MQFYGKKIFLILRINFIKYLPFFSGPFRWNEAKNTLLLRELYSLEPFRHKVGSRKAGQKWAEVAETLITASVFLETCPRFSVV